MGFSQPTPIQEQVIPVILKGADLIACAQTGTGKTAAYLLPTLHRIAIDKIPHTSALIVAPTRELAQQIDNAFQGFAYFTHASSIAVYGGSDGQVFEREKKALGEGTSVVIATPGRLLSHLNNGYVKFDKLDVLILDEADKMLDMGFYEDILRIIRYLPQRRQNLLFSATMPSKMRELAKRILHNPTEVNIAISKPAAGILQNAYLVYDTQKIPLTRDILIEKNLDSVLIFASTKSGVKALEKELLRMKLSAKAIHSDLTQSERENVLLSFRNRNTKILVATDILSRGIDIENIGLVINYDVPGDAEDYVHRVGRTARAASTGEAITLINEKDQRRFSQIEELIEKVVPKLPLPAALGEGPEWQPQKKHFSSHKSGSGRPFHKRNSNSKKGPGKGKGQSGPAKK
ncbi:MAG: DEAD/DEAH box helicase [Bacteroidetes bacterium]|nr:MAG: DEAD/DEAH box helicase [Bacteroidota bacterium]